MSNTRRIPSKEDLARAAAIMDDRFKNLSLVRDSLISKFADKCNLHNIYVIPEGSTEYRILVFLKTDNDIKACTVSGLIRAFREFAHAELERVGRSVKSESSIHFEFDSDENVTINYEGDYWKRLR